MEVLRMFNVIIWTIVGILNLKSNKIDKVSYAITWTTLMVYVIFDLIEIIV